MPPDNVDSLTDDEKVQDDDVMIDDELPSDVCGTEQVQNILNREHNDDYVEDNDGVKEE